MTGIEVFMAHLDFRTRGEIEFVDLSERVQQIVDESGIRNGIAHVFAPHATGILIITEDEPGLLEDMKEFIDTIVPRNRPYEHPSNAHSHLRSILLAPDKTLPVVNGRIGFGTWQSLMFVETDVYPRHRTVTVQIMGEK